MLRYHFFKSLYNKSCSFKVGKFRTKEDRKDAELRKLLGNEITDAESIHGTLPWRRHRKDGKSLVYSIVYYFTLMQF